LPAARERFPPACELHKFSPRARCRGLT
jgi:hypothetical protein